MEVWLTRLDPTSAKNPITDQFFDYIRGFRGRAPRTKDMRRWVIADPSGDSRFLLINDETRPSGRLFDLQLVHCNSYSFL